MSAPDRIADAITNHSRIVLVVLLLTTALVGAGVAMLDDDASMDQFESESEEAQAQEYIDDNFSTEETENTTTVQVIARGDDVLTQESLLSSLEFQQEIHDNESVGETLVDDDPMTGVENLVATTAYFDQRVDELEERGEELEEEGAQLENDSAELEAASDQLESEFAEFEAEQEAFAEQEAELEAQTEALEEALGEVQTLQTEYETLNQTAAAGEVDEAEYEQEAAAIESEIDAIVAEATAELSDEQAATFETAVEQVRTLTSELAQLEAAGADDAAEADELEADLEDAFELGTAGVFADEFEELEERGESLAERGEELESQSEELEERGEELEERGEELDERGEELEDDQEALEDADQPDLDEQLEILESLSDEEFEDALVDTLSDDDDGDDFALELMPTEYDPGSTSADARMLFVTQETEEEVEVDDPEGMDDELVESQLDLRELADEQDDEYVVFGFGVMTDEMEQSMGDSLAIVGPLALLFVAAALTIAYRDVLDIALGIVGIVAVLGWTFGFMGWAGIAFNQMMVAVPVLLIGLSIDYAIHVFMRHREQREADRVASERSGGDEAHETPEASNEAASVRGSMNVALAGVGVALVWVTATMAIGFVANFASPIGPIREFGAVTAFGIAAALLVFGALVPAAKIELDSFLEARGYDRHKRAFGTGEGRLSDALAVGAVAARKAPILVLVVGLVLTAGGAYGATQIDTSFDEEDFLADSPPEWTDNLPGPMSPGEYRAGDDLEFVNDNFQRDDAQAQILVGGDVTDDETLQRIDEAEHDATASDVAYTLPTGEADVESPLTVMEDVAAENESFNESFTAADTSGDGVPDENVEALYDELLETESGASDVIYQADGGEYEAVQLTLAIDGDVDFDEATAETRDIAATIDDGGADSRWDAIATGDPIVSHVVEQDLLDTVLETLLLTLVAVFAFLTIAYRVTGNSATLGAVTILPVVLAVSWILGTMYLLDIPFNVLTGMITSLTIGLGVAYSVHISSRYTLELERQGNVWDAMYTTVTGTGGALVGSAATTIGGFGTLAFAILPMLAQFGIVTGLTILYAFLASVIVLPSMLVLWTRYFGPDVSFDVASAGTTTPTASDGGYETAAADEGTIDEGTTDGGTIDTGGDET